jgi:hypothetical protein
MGGRNRRAECGSITLGALALGVGMWGILPLRDVTVLGIAAPSDQAQVVVHEPEPLEQQSSQAPVIGT